MTKITEVTVSRSVKCNTGDYESVDFFTSAKAEVEDGDVKAAYADLAQTVERSMVSALLASYKARGKKIDADGVIRRHGLGKARGNTK